MRELIVQATTMAVLFFLVFALAPLVRRGLQGVHSETGRLHTLDGLRGLAAVAVLACHVNQYIFSFLGYTTPPAFGDNIGTLGVQMFFSLTAYLFVRKAINGRLQPEAFFIGRVRRILPLYFSVCIAGMLLAAATPGNNTPLKPSTLAETLDVFSFGFWQADAVSFMGVNMLQLVGVAWTLSYEWAFYLLLFPAYCLWRAGNGMRWAMALVVLVLAVRDFNGPSARVIWPFFLPGVLAAAFTPSLTRNMRHGMALAAMCALVLLFIHPAYWSASRLGLCAIVFFYVVHCTPPWMEWRPLLTHGRISYSIYLTQYLAIYPASILRFHQYVGPEWGIVIFLLVPVVTVCIATLTYRWIELPWMRPQQPDATKGRLCLA